eukprot:m.111103 g.111103  ORF g.111103 m.111103 type:complete len:69 (+) comp15375_c0_seq2:520-726(+)
MRSARVILNHLEYGSFERSQEVAVMADQMNPEHGFELLTRVPPCFMSHSSLTPSDRLNVGTTSHLSNQ